MSCLLLNSKACSPLLMFVRNGHRMRGKPPGKAETLSQRLEKENSENPEISRKNDIGFPFLKPSRSSELRTRLEHLKLQRKDLSLEKLARSNKLEINVDETKEAWLKTAGPFHLRKIAEHYGVYEHLFGKYAYFTPRVNLDIKFQQPDNTSCPVYHGNRIKSYDARNAPDVTFDHTFKISDEAGNKESLWTLVLTNPDGNLTEQNKEYVHWMVGNIPNGDLSKGDLIVPYLQPFPPKGTGYHRHIFVLYKQEKKMDFSDIKAATDSNKLATRTFSTFDFYRKHQDDITPAGLSFFQANWDDSLTAFFHDVLNMKEPVYDYDYPEAFINKQVAFPLKQAFNVYLDRYDDPKEVNKRYLEEKLSKTHPFDGPEPPLKFPNAHYYGDEPSWLKTETMKRRLKLGRINDVDNQ